MKTAMQELIEHIQVNATKFSLMNTYNILKEIEPYLEKEKEQIMAAVRYGQNNHTASVYDEGELYYNEIYNSDAPIIKSSIPNGTYTSQIDTNEIRN
jgi:hypothetical protein